MISETIKEEMKSQGKNQQFMVDIVNKKGKENKIQVTQSQLSNFLRGKTSLNIKIIEIILSELGLTFVKIFK